MRGWGWNGHAVGLGDSLDAPIEMTIRLLLRDSLAGRDDAVLMTGVVLIPFL